MQNTILEAHGTTLSREWLLRHHLKIFLCARWQVLWNVPNILIVAKQYRDTHLRWSWGPPWGACIMSRAPSFPQFRKKSWNCFFIAELRFRVLGPQTLFFSFRELVVLEIDGKCNGVNSHKRYNLVKIGLL